MQNAPILVILYAGLTHAFEADHLLAVSNIVSQRRRVLPALNDGVFWGLGHATTILVMGLIVLVGKMYIPERTFSYFEALVGCILVILAVYRLMNLFSSPKPALHGHPHVHAEANPKGRSLHKVSYTIGAIHGLAGSGALLLVAMTQFTTPANGIGYLSLYGAGSIIGMLMAASFFSIPFSKKLFDSPFFNSTLILLSSGLSIGYGIYIIFQNLIQPTYPV